MSEDEIVINIEDIDNIDSKSLINELSEELKDITGNDGRGSFNKDDINDKRSIFIIARDSNGEACGCCALRNYSQDTAELKRMYVRKKHLRIGSRMLVFIENKAREFKYKKIILETGIVNKAAVQFYKNNEYSVIKNYGKYSGRAEAVCFEKCID